MIQLKKTSENKWIKKYHIKDVFLNTKLEKKTNLFLQKQPYLDYKKIKEILKINYNRKFPLGYVLIHNANIVGFLGTLFSKRKVNNKNYIYCTIHTWVVDKNNRIVSHLLFKKLIKKKCVIKVLSPLPNLDSNFTRMGFRILKMKYRIVFLKKILYYSNENNIKIEKNLLKWKKNLNSNDWKICQDHHNPRFLKFIIYEDRKKTNFSLIVSNIIRKKKYFNVLNILYSSNPKLIKNNWNFIKRIIAKNYRISFCGQHFLNEIDCCLPNKVASSININKKICVKNLPSKNKFDTIYSEIIY